MINSISSRFDPIATGNPSSSAGVKSWPFGLLPARRMSTEDITGHVRPSPQTLQSAAWRSGEFRSETSMVPALQPHPVRSKKNISKLSLLESYHVADLCTPSFSKILQDTARGIGRTFFNIINCLVGWIKIDFLVGVQKVRRLYVVHLREVAVLFFNFSDVFGFLTLRMLILCFLTFGYPYFIIHCSPLALRAPTWSLSCCVGSFCT